jgi:thiamine-phosphate pyrophosphorylase
MDDATGGFAQAGEATEVWRAIDASVNRAGEALRVVEDLARFVVDDAGLTRLAKELRHDLAAAVAAGLGPRVSLRDVAGDVGAGMTASSGLGRRTPADVLAANAARAAQALRSLEELSPLVAAEAARSFEPLRYRVYALERLLAAAVRAGDLLGGTSLCVLLDGRVERRDFTRLVDSLFEAGVRMVQLRDKSLAAARLVELAREAVAIARRRCPDGRGLVIVNDRADVAVAADAAGVHVGATDIPVAAARRVIGPRRIVGSTAHDVAEARAGQAAGADYLGVGPCFPSPTKAFASFAPRDFLATVAREIGLPAFAIGGVTLERLDELTALGIRRVAVAAAVTGAADPAAAAAAFIARLARPPAP